MSKPSYVGLLKRYPPEELKKRYKERISKNKFNNFKLDKPEHMTWDEYWRQGDPERGITVKVIDNPPFGVIYRCIYEWGWNKALKYNTMEYE